jgi:AmmeMemoRadiSam system protein B
MHVNSTANRAVRRPAVAGLFYPDDPDELRAFILDALNDQRVGSHPSMTARAYVVPHAGYIYSGAIAAAAYAQMQRHASRIKRVVLLGPSHRVFLRGAAVPVHDAFQTPLGEVLIDREIRNELVTSGLAANSDVPHAQEHCLEVQLPFLQVILGHFTLVPIVLGNANARDVSRIIAECDQDPSTLILASSDLSHYHAYAEAQRIDAATIDAILRLETDLIGEQACGAVAINGLNQFARDQSLSVSEIAHCNSGDTAGDRARVVGYASFAYGQA